MSARDVVKVGRVSASGRSSAPAADLFLDKDSGLFFGRVGERRVEAPTKARAEALVLKALRRVTDLEWREVIVLRVPKRDASKSSEENGLPVYGASCSFEYLRRERADNPLKRTETFEREHREDFELRVVEESERASRAGFDKVDRKQRADERESKLRGDREDSSKVQTQYKPWHGEKEVVLPYTPEAWAGILRVDQALRETQARLDQFAATATAEKLVALLTGDALLSLPAAGEGGR
jgi:hypothetical protein